MEEARCHSPVTPLATGHCRHRARARYAPMERVQRSPAWIHSPVGVRRSRRAPAWRAPDGPIERDRASRASRRRVETPGHQDRRLAVNTTGIDVSRETSTPGSGATRTSSRAQRRARSSGVMFHVKHRRLRRSPAALEAPVAAPLAWEPVTPWGPPDRGGAHAPELSGATDVSRETWTGSRRRGSGSTRADGTPRTSMEATRRGGRPASHAGCFT